MLRRHLMGYLPSSLTPALSAVVVIYAFTRLLAPHEYGLWALASNVNLLVQSLLFYWLQVSITRFLPQARQDGRETALTGAVALGALASLVTTAALYAITLPLLGLEPDLARIMWLALPMLLARALSGIALAEYRAQMRIGRYNLVECGQTLLGLLVSLTLAWRLDQGAASLVIGSLAGSAVVVAPYAVVTLRRIAAGGIDRALLTAFLRYGLPLTANNALAYLLATSDRLLIEHYLDSAAVGVYAVACGVVDRAVSLVFLTVTMASFPLVVRAYDEGGAKAAQQRMRESGAMLMALAMPVAFGLLLANRQIAATLIGPEFRAMAVTVMPWMALTALLNGLAVYYFNHAFLLTNRTGRLVWLQMPAAALNIGLNILLLPRMGLMGAVIASALSYGLALGLSIGFGRRHLAIGFPAGPALRAFAACLPMTVLFLAVDFPETPLGLLMMVAAGIALYGPAALLLDVGGARRLLTRWRAGP